MQKLLIATCFILFSTLSVMSAEKITHGDLQISHPVLRATANGAKVGGGYLIIQNTGSSADRLIAAQASFAGRLEIHQMKMENDVMKMSALTNGLEIAPGETIKLVPGGYHLMLMKLEEQLSEGQMRTIKLTFEKAGSIDVEFHVKSIADTLKLKHDH